MAQAFGDSPHSFTSDCGLIRVHFDMEEFDFYIDALEGYSAVCMSLVLGRVSLWGLELLTEEECEPELLPGGGVRIYLTPTVPEEVRAAEAHAKGTPTGNNEVEDAA
ncbi:hypothetical protein ABZY93_22020 [Streptomyces smyrnaeus]|uniref:hypothetical protein n=1 Tax=Streptomyces smyrnaeus TaxID=1387713 RepID=UPI0033BD10CF